MSLKRSGSLGTARLLALAALAAGCVGLVTLAGALAACESAANLDVTFGDASASLQGDASPGGGDGGAADAGEAGAVVVTATLAGCPCDTTAGLGCCMPATGKPSCTPDTTVCAGAQGTQLRCVRPDPSTESTCCWHGTGAGAETALASACDGGPTACSSDSDCAGTGQECAMASCFKGTIAIGACGTVAPTCPQP